MSGTRRPDVTIVGAGAAGIGVGVACSMLDLDVRVLERDCIGASFRAWPEEMRFITPSFPGNSFGLTDLNAVTPDTSPAYTLDCEHPSGDEYADYLEAVVEFHGLSVTTGVEVRSVDRLTGDVTHHDERRDQRTAVDGGTTLEGDAAETTRGKTGLVLETSEGPLESEQVVWAAGQFPTPLTDPFPGADHCLHTSQVSSWRTHAERAESDEYLVIGGYESGIDAAVGLVDAGATVRVFDRGEPWIERGPDPSEVLSPYTLERLQRVVDTDRLFVEGGVSVERVERLEDEYAIYSRPAGGFEHPDGEAVSTIRTPTRPLIATGFAPTLGPVESHFPRTDGTIDLTDTDESPTTPGLFLAGPDVAHNGVKFCFIYKFRARFPVIADTIGRRLGVDTGALERYREQNMYLEDLSCCEPELCDC